MVDAISIGDLRLVRLVLEAFSDCFLRPDPQDGVEPPGAVGWACHALYRELPDYDSDWDGLPVPEVSCSLQVGGHCNVVRDPADASLDH